MGEKVRRFETMWAEYLGVRHAIMVNSGSSANLVAAAVLVNPAFPDRLRPGDEVIVPAVAWSTTYYPLVNMGLVPVLVDVDLETFTLDPAAVERAIGPRTRAMMPVHLLGNSCDMRALGRAGPSPPAAHRRGHLRGPRRAIPGPPGRHLRRHGHLQLLLLAPHQHDRGRGGRDQRRPGRRPVPHAARARLDARRQEEARRPEPRHRRALPVREPGLQLPGDRGAGGVRHPPGAQARGASFASAARTSRT